MELPPIVGDEEWQRSHEQLLAKEKEATKAADALAAERRRAPMKEVSTDFSFEGPEGEVGVLDLFDGRSQLILYHFWFPEGGKPCVGCSMVGDQLTDVAHVNARDTTFAFVSRANAPLSPASREFLGLAREGLAELARRLRTDPPRQRTPG